MDNADEFKDDDFIVLNYSGRGDKDIDTILGVLDETG